MKNLIVLCLSIFIFGCDKDCDKDNRPRPRESADTFFQGNHELLTLNSFSSKVPQTTSVGSYFLFVGGFYYENSTTIMPQVTFCWKNYKNEYLTSSVPFNKVRFQMDSLVPQTLL